MADPHLKVRILTDIAGLRRGMRDAERTVSGAAARMRRIGDGMVSVGKKMTLGVSLPLAAFGASSLKVFADIDKGLRNVNGLFGLTGTAGEKSFEQLKKGVKSLSSEIGVAQTTLTDGLYQAISKGVPRENAFEFMRVAAKAAIAGLTDTSVAVDGITTIINAFGLKAADAQRVAESMFAVVAGGGTNFEQLSSAMFNVAPAAAAAGVSFQEMNAAIAVMTLSGVPTSVAATKIRAAIVGLARPSKDLDKIFGALGFKSALMAVKQKGLAFALSTVAGAAKGDIGVMQTLLGSVEAVDAANVIAADNMRAMGIAMEGQGKGAIAMGAAMENAEKTTARRLERLKTKFDNLRADIGEALLPIAEDVGRIIGKAIDWFNKLPQGAKDAAGKIAIAFGIGGPVMFVLGKVNNMVTGIWGTLSKIGKWTVGAGGKGAKGGGVGGGMGGCCCCGAGGVGGAAGKGKGILGRTGDKVKEWGSAIGTAAGTVIVKAGPKAVGAARGVANLNPMAAGAAIFELNHAKDMREMDRLAGSLGHKLATVAFQMRAAGATEDEIGSLAAKLKRLDANTAAAASQALHFANKLGSAARENKFFQEAMAKLPKDVQVKIEAILNGKAAIEQWLARLRAGVNVPITPQARSRQRSQTTARKGGKQEFHGGGMVLPQGRHDGLRSDEVPAALQTGEFVFSRPSVKRLGVGFLSRLHRMHRGGLAAHRKEFAPYQGRLKQLFGWERDGIIRDALDNHTGPYRRRISLSMDDQLQHALHTRPPKDWKRQGWRQDDEGGWIRPNVRRGGRGDGRQTAGTGGGRSQSGVSSRTMMGGASGGGVTINVSQLVVREEADIERIARALHERWRRMANRGAA